MGLEEKVHSLKFELFPQKQSSHMVLKEQTWHVEYPSSVLIYKTSLCIQKEEVSLMTPPVVSPTNS